MAVDLPVVPSETVAQARTLWSDAIGGAIASITALAAGIANIVYVSKGGNDSTGVRGSIVHPFLTVQAAMNAAQTGDVVLVGPGLYNEAVTWPSVAGIRLVGSGRDSTIISQNSARPIQFTNSFTYNDVVIQDLTLTTFSATVGFSYSQAGAVTASFVTPLVFRNVAFNFTGAVTNAIQIYIANTVVFENCQFIGTSGAQVTYLKNCGTVTVRGCDLKDLQVDYDYSSTVPSLGRGVVSVYGTRLTVLTVNFNASVFCDEATYCQRISTALVDNMSSLLNGLLQFLGTCDGNADLLFTCTHSSTTFFKCAGALFTAGGTLNCAAVDEGTSSFRGVIALAGAVVDALSVGPWCNAFARGASIGSINNSGVTYVGQCERDVLSGAVDFSGGSMQNVVFAVPQCLAQYDVFFEFTGGPPATNAHPAWVGAKTNTGFSTTPSAAGNASTRWTAIKQP